jgi:DNA-binding transcriptional regulator YiaG
MAKSMKATKRAERPEKAGAVRKHRSERVRGSRPQPMKLRVFLDIPQEEFARLLGVSTRTVARWESEGVKPTPDIREQLDFLLKLSRRLDELIERKHITDWLTTPNPEFLNQPPVDLVQSKYGRRVLEQEIERAEWGIPG